MSHCYGRDFRLFALCPKFVYIMRFHDITYAFSSDFQAFLVVKITNNLSLEIWKWKIVRKGGDRLNATSRLPIKICCTKYFEVRRVLPWSKLFVRSRIFLCVPEALMQIVALNNKKSTWEFC